MITETVSFAPERPEKEQEVRRVPGKDHFPMCIVWCPIPMLTWLLPPVGHLGIVTSTGVIHDFAGPYYVNRSEKAMGFGSVTKYVEVELSDFRTPSNSDGKLKEWDRKIEETSIACELFILLAFIYPKADFLLLNCHSHVSSVLNSVEYLGFRHWNTCFLIFFLIYKSKYVSFSRFVQTNVGFAILLTIVLVLLVIAHNV